MGRYGFLKSKSEREHVGELLKQNLIHHLIDS